MSHRHFCDCAGHEWECAGTALRPLAGDTEPSMCICLRHQVPMEDGDHGDCPVELLACPEHRDEQVRLMGIFGANDLPLSKGDAESTIFKDKEGARIVGFCLWCNKDFYSIEEMEAHNADDSKECPVFRKWKSTH